MTFWVKTTDLNTHGIVSWGGQGDGEKWHIRINNNSGNGVVGAIRTEYASGQNVATTPIDDGQWHHVASVFPANATSSTALRHYVDGVFDPRSGGGDQNINTDITGPTAEPVRIGVRVQGGARNFEFFTGLVADVRIYDQELDEVAIQTIMEGGCPKALSPPPALVQIMGGVNGATDMWISPLGENVPFDTVDLDLTSDVEFASPQPGFTLTSNGGGNHTLTLDTPVPPGECVTLSFDVADSATGVVGTITITLCHLPLDVNQDGQVNIQDITAWGAEFNGARRAALTDTNGDGNVNVQDATAVGDNWFGRPPATKPWNGESLP